MSVTLTSNPVSFRGLRLIDDVLLRRMRGGKTRVLILEALKSDSLTCLGISRLLNVNWGSISRHLVKLRDVGLVSETRIGRICYYNLTSLGDSANTMVADKVRSRVLRDRTQSSTLALKVG